MGIQKVVQKRKALINYKSKINKRHKLTYTSLLDYNLYK